jgi:methanogenic corrinoid protein MtbC1
VAQEHYGTAVTQAIISQLYPRIFGRQRVGRRLVAACAGGETHELGARMVADFFEMAGWDTYYLGANMPAGSLARYVEQHAGDVVAISATMSITSRPSRRWCRVCAPRRPAAASRILCGGNPFNVSPDLWRRLGADGTAPDGCRAVLAAEALLAAGARAGSEASP